MVPSSVAEDPHENGVVNKVEFRSPFSGFSVMPSKIDGDSVTS